MYNPQNLSECEKEKQKKQRGIIDTAMTVVGAVASLSSVPQVVKIWQTHSVEGISLATYAISLFTVLSWLAYGIYIKNKPLAITSGISSVVLGIVVFQLVYFSS